MTASTSGKNSARGIAQPTLDWAARLMSQNAVNSGTAHPSQGGLTPGEVASSNAPAQELSPEELDDLLITTPKDNDTSSTSSHSSSWSGLTTSMDTEVFPNMLPPSFSIQPPRIPGTLLLGGRRMRENDETVQPARDSADRQPPGQQMRTFATRAGRQANLTAKQIEAIIEFSEVRFVRGISLVTDPSIHSSSLLRCL